MSMNKKVIGVAVIGGSISWWCIHRISGKIY